MRKPYSQLLTEIFGEKVRKLNIDAGLTCPNRDGTLGRGGCVYCNNAAFVPEGVASARIDIPSQIERGKRFYRHKQTGGKYVAYFQAFTGTYADVDQLEEHYRQALDSPDVAGLIISTRPDCVPDEVLLLLSRIQRDTAPVMVEYGVETTHDETLLALNRCHDWATATDAIIRTADAGIPCGAHLILGLPGEDEQMMLQTVERLCALPVRSLKFHQLQVLRGTRLAKMWQEGSVSLPSYTAEEYASLCRRLDKTIPSHIVIERWVATAPAKMLLHPRWDLKLSQFETLLQI